MTLDGGSGPASRINKAKNAARQVVHPSDRPVKLRGWLIRGGEASTLLSRMWDMGASPPEILRNTVFMESFTDVNKVTNQDGIIP